MTERSTDLDAPGYGLDYSKMPGHWLLAQMGKKVLRPGGVELTSRMLEALDISATDEVVEFALGLGLTARAVLERKPASYTGIERDDTAARQVGKYLNGPGSTMPGWQGGEHRFARFLGHCGFWRGHAEHADADPEGLDRRGSHAAAQARRKVRNPRTVFTAGRPGRDYKVGNQPGLIGCHSRGCEAPDSGRVEGVAGGAWVHGRNTGHRTHAFVRAQAISSG